MSAPLSRLAAVATVVGFPLAVLVALAVAWAAGGEAWAQMSGGSALAIPFGAFGLVGALILWHRPGNVVGWVCAGMGLLYALGTCVIAYAGWWQGPTSPPGTVLAAWIANWVWSPLMGMVLIALPLLIPDGRLVSPRWRWVAGLGAVSIGGLVVLAMVQPQLGTPGGTVTNPIGIQGAPSPMDSTAATVFFVGVVTASAGAVASIIVRYRRAHPTERVRLKWIVFAFALMLVIDIALDIVQRFFLPGGIGNAIWAAVLLIPAAGIGIAVLRHRLFDIDRIVSRTVSYAVVTAVLAGVYVAGVFGLGGVLRAVTGGGAGDLVVAASTLLVAAAFGPVRRHAQTVVDRRFNRDRYNATGLVEAFTHRLRDGVDLDVLAADIHEVAVRAIQPSHASIWLVSSEPRR